MAKEITKIIKLQIEAGKATPAPPVGTALGPAGVNIAEFVKQFNARTAKQNGMIVPAQITFFSDKSFTFVVKSPPAAVLLAKAVGIDVGIKSFAYDSDGCQTPNPLNLKKMLKPLARIQRKISRKKKGSNNRLKAILHMQRIHEKITNRRKDFQHKLSTQYAKNNDIVFVEKLEKLNMVKNHKLARSIMIPVGDCFCKNWNTSANC